MLGLRLQKYLTTTKRYPLQKVSENPESVFQPELSGERKLNSIYLSSNIA